MRAEFWRPPPGRAAFHCPADRKRIREPLYLTALRYAGVDITPEKHPSHVDSLVLNEADTTALRNWFTAYPQPEAAPAPKPLLEVRDLSFGYQKGQATLKNVRFSIGKGEMVSIVGRNARANPRCPSSSAGSRRRMRARSSSTENRWPRRTSAAVPSTSAM